MTLKNNTVKRQGLIQAIGWRCKETLCKDTKFLRFGKVFTNCSFHFESTKFFRNYEIAAGEHF